MIAISTHRPNSSIVIYDFQNKMPRCLMNSVRDYKRGKYHGSFVYDPFVMTTRSGLSINTLPRGTAIVSGRRNPSPPDCIKEQVQQPKKKEIYTRKRSLSYLSLVTRFHLSQRIPGVETSPKAFADWKAELFRIDHTRVSETLTESDSDSEDDICIGSVDDSPCTYSQSSDDSNSTFDESTKSPTARPKSVSPEIDVVNSKSDENLQLNNKILTKGKLPKSANIKTSKASNKFNVTDNIHCFQANSLVCTTLGRKMAYSVVNELTKPSSAAGSAGQLNINRGQPQKIVTLADASSLFFVKPNTQAVNEYSKRELERLEEREKYCKNGLQACSQCGKEFFLFSALQSHIRRHGKAENKCHECGKIFSRSWLLKGHLRTHTGERPFNCPDEECDKAFADKSNLRSHMLIHSNKHKTHVCAKCGRGFAQKRYLHKHMLEVCRLVVT